MDNIRNKELFETMPIAKAIGKMAVPTIFGQLIVLIYSIADTFFIGRANNPFMVAGASLILPIFNISIAIACLAGVGGSALLSNLLGISRTDEAKKVYSFSIYLSFIISAFFSLFTLVFMHPLLRFLGAGADTFEYAKEYALCVIVLGGIPTILSNVLSNFIRSIGDSVKAAFGITLGGVINIALDPLFMFVLLPRGKEILAAGIATLISNCISFIYFIITIKNLKNSSVLSLTSIKNLPEKESIRKIFAIGIPSSISTLLFDLDYVVIDRLMSAYGDIPLAAVGIVLKAERLPTNICVGICQGMLPIVAYNYSSGNYKRMREASRFSLILGVVCGVVSITLYEIFAPYVMRFFIDDIGTVTLGQNFLRIRCLATVFMFLCFYHVFLFNGYVRGKEAMFLGIVRWAVFNIPMLFLLNSIIGIYGIVWSQLVADILTVALSVIVHRRFLKKNNMLT